MVLINKNGIAENHSIESTQDDKDDKKPLKKNYDDDYRISEIRDLLTHITSDTKVPPLKKLNEYTSRLNSAFFNLQKQIIKNPHLKKNKIYQQRIQEIKELKELIVQYKLSTYTMSGIEKEEAKKLLGIANASDEVLKYKLEFILKEAIEETVSLKSLNSKSEYLLSRSLPFILKPRSQPEVKSTELLDNVQVNNKKK